MLVTEQLKYEVQLHFLALIQLMRDPTQSLGFKFPLLLQETQPFPPRKLNHSYFSV